MVNLIYSTKDDERILIFYSFVVTNEDSTINILLYKITHEKLNVFAMNVYNIT